MRQHGASLPLPDVRDIDRCPACGHPVYCHEENMPTQRSKPGDPMACYAFSAGEFCGCRARLGER